MVESEIRPAISTRKLVALLAIVALALLVRGLTANFVRAHLNDPAWFQLGSFKIFDRQAQDVLDGKEPFFWISDSTRTDLIQYPPGNLVWIGAIYAVTGDRSAASVQRVQWVLDAFAVLLIVAIAVTAYGWTPGVTAGVLAALSPLLSLYSATPGADVPTNWFILAGVWLSLLAFKRKSVPYALGAGALLGLSCWLRVNPLLLFIPWAIALYFLVRGSRKNRALLATAVSASTLLVVTPLIARNLIVFYPEVAPTGLNVGGNLLEGIGETDRGAEFGAPCCDELIIQEDRRNMGLAPDVPLGLVYPDGIRRDRERGQRALAIIRAHPVWYAGVMVKRALGHLKLAGKPAPSVGSAGINVTSAKCLPTHLQFIPLSIAVNSLGMVQSVLRYSAPLFMLWGIWVGLRRGFRVTLLVLSTVIYFLVTLAVGHSEIRYGLPMQGLLIVFQARGLFDVVARIKRR
ncbi:MAG TPA: glycosyltransferase family 39 protein [Pyrinomonadaceae bacterium]|nr:glycosyltransferase family 39 protein [Pyrinomonadaceae bacterium]